MSFRRYRPALRLPGIHPDQQMEVIVYGHQPDTGLVIRPGCSGLRVSDEIEFVPHRWREV